MTRLAAAIFVSVCAAFSAQAADPILSLDDFKRMLVQDNGRIKPMDTYARSVLLQLSAKSSYEKRPAVAWLADTLFVPEKANDYKVFRINSPEVIQAIGIEEETHFRYSFNQLKPHMDKLYELAVSASKIEASDRTPVEKEFLKLYSLISFYLQNSRSFIFATPHRDFEVTQAENRNLLSLPSDKNQITYADIAVHFSSVQKGLAAVPRKSNDQRTPAQNELVKLSQNFVRWKQHYEANNIPVIPQLDAKRDAWLGPFQALASPTEQIVSKITSLAAMANAYRANDSFNFQKAVAEFNQLVMEEIDDATITRNRDLELFYNGLNPFYRAQISYGLSFILALCSLLIFRRFFYWTTILIILTGFIPHVAGIAIRMIILGRPPVTNLFDTFVFVAAMSVLLGLVMELFSRKGLGLITASVSGLALLLISNKYAMEGDTLQVLVAVLDSNFWLSTHVITISLGYTGCCVAGVVGHIWMLQALFDPNNADRLQRTYGMVFGITAFGLIFSFIGTVLGGIWADQSWGRFWGWDPKENGALLIVLWCAILFHAKLALWIDQLGFAIGSIIGIIVVMLAWFGINLLGVGLHSYGFTSGIAKALFIYIGSELVFIAVTSTIILWKTGRLPLASRSQGAGTGA
jgi:ABC-type transport system involved in cytochrome c biogenesis permease subunit